MNYFDHQATAAGVSFERRMTAIPMQDDQLATTIRAGIDAHKREQFEREMVRAEAGMDVVEHAMPERGLVLRVV
jgi:hypothetical protein